MKEVNIKFTISPFDDTNLIERSKANKLTAEVIQKITKQLESINSSQFSFDFQITTK